MSATMTEIETMNAAEPSTASTDKDIVESLPPELREAAAESLGVNVDEQPIAEETAPDAEKDVDSEPEPAQAE